MELKFLNYDYEQLLEDKSFTSWVIKGENHAAWARFISENQEFKIEADKAMMIICLLQDKVDALDDIAVNSILKNIEQYDALHKIKIRKHRFIRRLKIAASILLVMSLGSLLYFHNTTTGKNKFFSEVETRDAEAQLKISSGEEIALRKANSSIAFDVVNDQVIVNDSVIQLGTEISSGKNEIKTFELVIPYGKKSDLLLADGTRVWLNAGSRLAFPSSFTKDTREVFLEGEAFFDVVTNESQPFVVTTQFLAVKVLGTKFNISAYQSDYTIETILLEGEVLVRKTKAFGLLKEDIVMKPNQRVSFDKADKIMELEELKNAEALTAWTRGWLEYQKESLASVLHKVERYFNIELKLPPDYPADDIITGKLDLEGSLEEVLQALADASGFDFYIIGQTVVIKKS